MGLFFIQNRHFVYYCSVESTKPVLDAAIRNTLKGILTDETIIL